MDYLGLAFGLVSVAGSVPMLINPAKAREKTESLRQARMAALDAGAPESFHEERRTLDAYPPIKTNTGKRAFGAFLLLLGIYAIWRAFGH